MKKAKLLLSLSSVALLAGLTGCGSVKGAEYTPGNTVKVGLICLHDTNSTYDAECRSCAGSNNQYYPAF